MAIGEMKRMLTARGVRLPAPRFDATDAELLRYADDGGLLNVKPRSPCVSCLDFSCCISQMCRCFTKVEEQVREVIFSLARSH